MGERIESRALWLNAEFWDLLDCLKDRDGCPRADRDRARRELDRVDPKVASEFRVARARYCEVIAELDCTAGDTEPRQLKAG
jgi:hypothetical protein